MRFVTKRYLLYTVLWFASMVCSCTTSLLPSPVMPRTSRARHPDEEVLDILRADWEKLQHEMPSDAERQSLIKHYNKWLLTLLHRIRYDLQRADRSGNGTVFMKLDIEHVDLPPWKQLMDVYDDIIPAEDVQTKELEERYILPGIGVPLVGIIPAAKIRPRDNLQPIRTRGTVSTLTALLEFPEDGGQRPLLKLIPRHWNEEVSVGKRRYPLAGDFSAAMEIYWNFTKVKKGRYLGLLRPQRLQELTGLSCMERYSPDKIPVVLVHGFASSADTFDDLVNRLISDATIRNNYQFWYFNYPTGLAWTYSAAQFRQALQEVRNTLDRDKKNSNWDRMVIIGHSMGGLIAHYSQCTEPWKMLKQAPFMQQSCENLLDKQYIDTPLPLVQLEKIRSIYYFHPVKASQIIYMATPHRGVPMARKVHGILLARLVKLPEHIVHDIFESTPRQIGGAARFSDWLTSIGQLAPDSFSICGMASLSVQAVPTHSIIGDKGWNNSPHSSDGVVPYWSSHLPWGAESIVPTDHSVQDAPETAKIVKRILIDNLHRLSQLESK